MGKMDRDLIRNAASPDLDSEWTRSGIGHSLISKNTKRVPRKAQRSRGHVFDRHARQIKEINRSFSKQKTKSVKSKKAKSIRKQISSKLQKKRPGARRQAGEGAEFEYRTYQDNKSSNSGMSGLTFVTRIPKSKGNSDLLERFRSDNESRLEKRLQRKKKKVQKQKTKVLVYTPERKRSKKAHGDIQKLLVARRKEFIREQVQRKGIDSKSPLRESEPKKEVGAIEIDEPNDERDEDFYSRGLSGESNFFENKLFGSGEEAGRFTAHLEHQLARIRQKLTNQEFPEKPFNEPI